MQARGIAADSIAFHLMIDLVSATSSKRDYFWFMLVLNVSS